MTENINDAAAFSERSMLANTSNMIVQDHEEQLAAYRANFEHINSSVNGLNSLDIIGMDDVRTKIMQGDFAKEVDNKFQLSEADEDRLSKPLTAGLDDIIEDSRIEEECKDYDDSIKANPMDNETDQKLRQRIGRAILSGKPEELEAVLREHRPTSDEPGRIDGVMKRVEEDLRKKGISVHYSVAITMDYDQAAGLLNRPIGEVKNAQLPSKYIATLEISKGNQNVRVVNNENGVVTSSAFVNPKTEGSPPPSESGGQTTPEEGAARMKALLEAPPRQSVNAASALRKISK